MVFIPNVWLCDSTRQVCSVCRIAVASWTRTYKDHEVIILCQDLRRTSPSLGEVLPQRRTNPMERSPLAEPPLDVPALSLLWQAHGFGECWRFCMKAQPFFANPIFRYQMIGLAKNGGWRPPYICLSHPKALEAWSKFGGFRKQCKGVSRCLPSEIGMIHGQLRRAVSAVVQLLCQVRNIWVVQQNLCWEARANIMNIRLCPYWCRATMLVLLQQVEQSPVAGACLILSQKSRTEFTGSPFRMTPLLSLEDS